MIKEQTASATTDQQESTAKAPKLAEDSQKSSTGGQELLPSAAFTTYYTWTANGVHKSVNFAHAGIKANSRVFVNISEYSGSATTGRFIGAAKMAVYNIAPFNGGFKAWVEITWSSPLTVRFDVFVDP